MMIDIPDDVLLDIFDFHRIGEPDYVRWKWTRLMHVCRRWRQIIFASPIRLQIQLFCTNGAPVRTHLGCWPAFPINIHYDNGEDLELSPDDEDNFLAALEHPNRVYGLKLDMRTPQLLAKLVTVIREPFPGLTTLRLSLNHWIGPCAVIPSGFLGGSAPCLQELRLDAIRLQELPTLLSSTRGLVKLHLTYIPPTGYISPEGMVACLAALTRLEYLHIGTLVPHRVLPHRIDTAPVTRTVLPALTSIGFDNVCNYVEDLIARIDCPRFNNILLTYRTSIDFQVSRVFKFINRSGDPWLAPFSRVDVEFKPGGITLKVSHKHHYVFRGRGWQVWHVVKLFSQFPAMLSNVRHLSLSSSGQCPGLPHTDTDWVQFLYTFTNLRTLCLHGSCAIHVTPALEDVDEEMADEFLPALDLIYIKERPVSLVGGFCLVRLLSGRPISVVGTQEEFDERFKSYPSE